MVRWILRVVLSLGTFAVWITSARAGPPVVGGDAAAPLRRVVQAVECVPETYTVKRLAYRVECRQETFEAFRCVTVPECRERQVTVVKRVPVTTWEVRQAPRQVTEYDTRTIMKPVCRTVEECIQQKRLVSLGCWDTKQVCVPSCDPCCPPRTVCVKYWRYCPQYECVPVKVCRQVTVDEPCTIQVPVCRTILCEEKVPVCTYQEVPEIVCEKYTVNVVRRVPYQATRCVRVWVPYEECVTLTRMVQRVVCREVCVNPCVAPSVPAAPACDEGAVYASRLRGLLVGRHTALASR
jgi:hypothetical protein